MVCRQVIGRQRDGTPGARWLARLIREMMEGLSAASMDCAWFEALQHLLKQARPAMQVDSQQARQTTGSEPINIWWSLNRPPPAASAIG